MTKTPSKMAIAKGIGRYLDELDAGELGPVPITKGRWSSDPDEIVARADKIAAERAETTSAIARLKLLQKERELRAAAEAHRAQDGSAREHFVTYGALWAEHNGIDYATLRDFGVPADVLRDAGIEP